MTMMETIKEAVCVQGLLDDLGIDQDLLKINCDSMSAIYLVKNLMYHARTKHIDIIFHFVREILDEGDIELQKIYTKENPIDMLRLFRSKVCTLQGVAPNPSYPVA